MQEESCGQVLTGCDIAAGAVQVDRGLQEDKEGAADFYTGTAYGGRRAAESYWGQDNWYRSTASSKHYSRGGFAARGTSGAASGGSGGYGRGSQNGRAAGSGSNNGYHDYGQNAGKAGAGARGGSKWYEYQQQDDWESDDYESDSFYYSKF